MTPLTGIPPGDHGIGRLSGAAIVTGGGQGLGRAFCLELARRGANVVVADLRPDTADRVAGEASAIGGRSIGIQVDVADEASVERMVRTAADAFGPPTTLVNNAAIFSTLKMRPF